MPAIEDNIIAISESIDPANYVVATYLAQGPAHEDMLSRATAIAVEQTVGRGVFNMKDMQHLVISRGGRLISFLPIPDHESKSSLRNLEWKTYVFRVAFPVENTGFQIPMLLTTILSDVSMSGMIKLIDLVGLTKISALNSFLSMTSPVLLVSSHTTKKSVIPRLP